MLSNLFGSNVDWDATGSMLSGIGTLIGAAAVLIAALVGRSTFADWKRQKIEERRIAAAEEILTTSYQLKEAYNQIRFPSATSAEQNRAIANMNESRLITDDTTIEQRSRLLSPQITIDRVNSHGELWSRLAELMPRAKALFGENVSNELEVIRQQRGKILAAANGLASLATQRYPHREDLAQRQDARRARYEAIIWDGSAEGDPLSVEINTAVAALDRSLGPVIETPPAS